MIKAKYSLTKEALEKLKAELDNLKVQRKEAIARIKVAKGYGDLSENSEYEEARENQGVIETRIMELEEIIRNANVIDIYDDGETIEIVLDSLSKKYRYQKNGNSIDVVDVNESSTKKIIPEIPNITFDNSVPLFNDIDGRNKNFELSIKINYSIGTSSNSKLFTTSVTKRN